MEIVSRWILTFLVNSLWQGALIAAVALMASWLMRKGPASHRHMVWVAALIAALVLPLASMGVREETPSQPFTASFNAQRPDVPLPPGLKTAWDAASGTPVRKVPVARNTAVIAVAAYLLFLLVRFGKLGLALFRTRQIRASAVLVRQAPQAVEDVFNRCRQVFSLRSVELLSSTDIPSPVTAGVTRSLIILPDCLLYETSPDLLSAAIGHEMAHIARRDYSFSLLYELLYLPVAFHPAAWLIRREISRTREMACDELVTRKLLNAGAYARSILSIATTMKVLSQPGYTLGIFDGDNLEERIKRLVKHPAPNLKQARLWLATSLTAIALCAAIASTVTFTVRAQTGSYGEMKLAERAYNTGDYPGAVQHFENAVKLDQSNVKPRLFLANALLQLFRSSGDRTLLDRARQQYLDVLIYEARNTTAMHGLITIATELKQSTQAHDWALKLIQADPTDKVAYYKAAVVDWAIVFAEYQQAKKQEGSRMEEYSLTTESVRKSLRDRYLGTVEEGIAFLEKAVALDAGYDDALAYENLLYRLQASLTDDPTQAAGFIAAADGFVGQALAIRRARGRVSSTGASNLDVDGNPPGPAAQSMIAAPPPPPPPPPPGFRIARSMENQTAPDQAAPRHK